MYIKQAATVAELMSYIEKIERLDITAENYKTFLKADVRDVFMKAGDLGSLVDVSLSSQMRDRFLKEMRRELYAQAVVLRAQNPPLPVVPAMTEDAATDISVWLRQWCVAAIRQEQDASRPSLPHDIAIGMPKMQTLHDATRAVFINYAHCDNEDANPKHRWLDRLLQMLRPLVSQHELTHWSDRDIKAGDDWHARIQAQLEVAKAAILLVSPGFLASDYIRNSELPVLLKNAADRGVRIFPIIVRPCLYERANFKYPDPKRGPNEVKLSSIQAANPPSKALTEMTEAEQDRVLLNVAMAVHDLITTEAASRQVPAIVSRIPNFHRRISQEWKLELQARVIDPRSVEGLLTRVRTTLVEYSADLDSDRYPAVNRQIEVVMLELTNVLRDNPFKRITDLSGDQWMAQTIQAMASFDKLKEVVANMQ